MRGADGTAWHALIAPILPSTGRNFRGHTDVIQDAKEGRQGSMNEPAGVWKYVRGLERLSLCDWPGKTSCVVFLGGCNLRCPTCHNGELAWRMERLPVLPDWRLKVYLGERAGWLDGVTVTGGEPTDVPGVAELLWEIKKFKLPIKVDSNGMRPSVIGDLIQYRLADMFAVDVKGPFHKYPALTGHAVTEDAARRNLDQVFAMAELMPDRFYFRLTRVPGLTDEDVDVARSYLPAGFDLTIQEYVPRRSEEHAQPDHETRRPVRDLVD